MGTKVNNFQNNAKNSNIILNLRLFLEEVKFMFRNGQGRWELYSDIVKNKFGVYRSYFVDKYSGEKEKCRSLFLKYGKFEDPNF